MNKLTVVVINDYAYENGGAARVAISEACALAKRGHEVFFFAACGPAAKELEKAGVHVELTEQPDLLGEPFRLRAAFRGLWNVSAAQKLSRLLEKIGVSRGIAHVHGYTKALSSSVVRAAAEKGSGVFLTLHDYFPICPNGAFYLFPKGCSCPYTPLSLACITTHCDARNYAHKLWRTARTLLGHFPGRISKDIHRFFAVSEFCREKIENFLPPGKVAVLPNPVEVPCKPRTAAEKSREIVFAGRLSYEKGADLLLDAFREARLKGFKLVIIGDGPLREILHASFPGVQWLGWLTKKAFWTKLSQARALVYSTRLMETDGMAVSEAMAFGVPVIVPRGSAPAEKIPHEKGGWFFESGNTSDLRRVLKRLEDDREVEKKSKEAYHAAWKNPFTLGRHIAALERHYRMLEDNRKSSRR